MHDERVGLGGSEGGLGGSRGIVLGLYPPHVLAGFAIIIVGDLGPGTRRASGLLSSTKISGYPTRHGICENDVAKPSMAGPTDKLVRDDASCIHGPSAVAESLKPDPVSRWVRHSSPSGRTRSVKPRPLRTREPRVVRSGLLSSMAHNDCTHARISTCVAHHTNISIRVSQQPKRRSSVRVTSQPRRRKQDLISQDRSRGR